MRHFAAELAADNWQITYEIATDFLVYPPRQLKGGFIAPLLMPMTW